MQDIIMGLDPERNPKQIRVDESGFLRIGSSVAIARTTNPTKLADGIFTPLSADAEGRLITVPYQMRDLIATAAVDTATLAEVTLLANGGTGVFHDLVEMTCANQCSAAVTLSLRSVTAGNVLRTLVLPATATQSFRFPVPVPQDSVNNNWTIQNAGSGDISTTVVSISALFIKNL